jgi:Cof subfamily protein (haloacid dehalogenase superfamily)
MTAPVRLIAIDIDGTLLPSAEKRVSERNRRALLEAEAAGIEIVIATGRRQAYATPILASVGLKPETVFITSNGAVTRTLGGERIDRVILPVETARELCPILRQFGGTTVFTFDHDGPGELVLESIEQLHSRIALWVEANRPWIREVRPLEQAFDAGKAPVQGMVCGTLEDMAVAEEWLANHEISRRIEMHRTEYPTRNLTILDILPPGCSKGVALGKLAAARAIEPESIMAIGDNFNDLDMLRVSGRPVVMANAAPELLGLARGRGWEIAPSNDEDGVAAIIESVLAEASVQSCNSSVVE